MKPEEWAVNIYTQNSKFSWKKNWNLNVVMPIDEKEQFDKEGKHLLHGRDVRSYHGGTFKVTWTFNIFENTFTTNRKDWESKRTIQLGDNLE